ncbi:hypothetical protein QE439_004241 [Pedobacter agri]|nr:hypothetical protein [Pedobacter agri]
MEIFDSSPYVIERAKRMAPYFAKETGLSPQANATLSLSI